MIDINWTTPKGTAIRITAPDALAMMQVMAGTRNSAALDEVDRQRAATSRALHNERN